MMIKKFVADSYYEACLKAENELGEGMLIITSRTFQKGSWGGFLKKEMVEITVAIPRTPAEKPTKTAPARPAPTEDLTGKTSISQRPPSAKACLSETTIGEIPEFSTPSTPQKGTNRNLPGIAEYSKNAHMGPQGLRRVNTLRSNQEGNTEPQPQKLASDENETEKIQALLSEILKQKSGKTNDKGAASANVKTPIEGTIPESEHLEKPTIQLLEDKIAEITSMLKQIKACSDGILSSPPSSIPEGLFHMRKKLTDIEMPIDVLEGILDQIKNEIPYPALKTCASAESETAKWLEKRLKVSSEPQSRNSSEPKIFVLIGPTGVGKTTTIAKLAASFALNVVDRRSVALFTLDTFRIGAPAQLSQYAQIIEAGMEIILEPEDITPALERHRNKDIILVDTAGRCQKNKSELGELRNFLRFFPTALKYLVLSATTKYTDMIDTIRKFGEVGFDQLIFTKVDETNSFGPLLAVMYRTKSPLAYFTDGQSVPDDFKPANLQFFLNKLFTNQEKKQ